MLLLFRWWMTLICTEAMQLSVFFSIAQPFFSPLHLFYKVVWSDDWICSGIFSPSRRPTDTQYYFFSVLCFSTLVQDLERRLIFISNWALAAQTLKRCCGHWIKSFIRKPILWISTDWSVAQEGRLHLREMGQCVCVCVWDQLGLSLNS